jgi:hypothetical protein
MTTDIKFRKLLHRKRWEMCWPSPGNTVAGSFLAGDKGGVMPAQDCLYFVNGVNGVYLYNPDQDAWMQLPNSGVAGTFAAGSCGEFRSIGMLGGALQNTASAGTATTLTTNRNITRDIRGSRLTVVAGTGVGYAGSVASNTTGANAVLTVTPASGVAFDNTSVFQVWSGSLWFFNAGTTAVGLSVYDRATNAWTAKSVTGLPTAWGTCGQLISTGSVEGAFETGTSTGSNTTTTLNNTGKAWPVNAYANAQVRITGGTGNGQVRAIASNTATALTVSAAWTITPDATSTYSIEGNDDTLYLLGNNSVTLYKYSISGNTWVTVAPGTARGGALAAGGTADWVMGVTDPDWAGAQGKYLTQSGVLLRQNGRYIYSMRGGGSSTLDVYDTAAVTWISALPYGNQMETFTTGSCSVDYGGYIYLMKEAVGRLYRLNVAGNYLEPWSNVIYPSSTTVEGDKLAVVQYTDGAIKIPIVFWQPHSRPELMRQMVLG